MTSEVRWERTDERMSDMDEVKYSQLDISVGDAPLTRSEAATVPAPSDDGVPAGRGVGGEGAVPSGPYRQRGFTLVELWVSILIVGTIAGITLAAFQRGTQTEKLRSARDEMLDDLRTMRSYSVSGRPVVDTAGAECTVDKCGGYGIYLAKLTTGYSLYQDYNGNKTYGGESSNEFLQKKQFATGVKIDEITYVNCGSSYGGGSCYNPGGTNPSVGSLEIYFAPYFGTTTLLGHNPTYSLGQQVTIRLRDTASNRTMDFTVDKLAGGIRE